MDSCSLMSSRLQAAQSFSRRDWWILWQAWVMLLATDLGLRVLPFRRIRRYVATTPRDTPTVVDGEVLATVQRVRRLMDIAQRHHLYRMRCLTHALALQWMLGRRGIATELRIGVDRGDGGLSAHAWLERAGQPIGEPQGIETTFVPLVAHEADR